MLIHIATWVILIYLGLLLLMFVAQRKLIYPASRDLHQTPASYGWHYEDVELPVLGKTTHAWWIPFPTAKGTVLFSHGNAGNIADRLESVATFRKLGFNVLLYDYGGYGKSKGSPSEKRCCADIRAMWTHLVEERGIPANEIVLFGRSLGGGPTAQLATEVKPAAVILESTFLSLPTMAQELYPIFPARYLALDRFDNAAKAPLIEAPVLVVHGIADEIIPYHHGRELFELIQSPKEFLELRGGHNEGYIISDGEYRQGLADFLDPLLTRPSSPEGH